MDFPEEKLQEFREHQKTQFLASQFDTYREKLTEAELLSEKEAIADLL